MKNFIKFRKFILLIVLALFSIFLKTKGIYSGLCIYKFLIQLYNSAFKSICQPLDFSLLFTELLYKISHNKLDKNIQEKINVNSFIKNKGVVKLTDIRRLKSALWKSKKRPNLLNHDEKGPKNINIDLKINNLGELEMNQIISTNISNTKQEILFDKQNQYLVYNSATNTDI